MSRGKRYSGERKLNIKKVVVTILVIIAIIVFVFAIKNLIGTESSNSLVSTSYFLINENNKWGVIDNTSKVIIEPTYEEPIIIPNSKRDIFICTYNANYETGEYETKVLNKKNEEIFNDFNKVQAIENYDENNSLWYEDNILKYQKDDKFGLINFSGEILLNAEYSKIYALKGTKGSIITEKYGKLGIINTSGTVQVENKYQEITSLGDDTKLYIVKENDKYGIDDVIECKYQEIKPLNDKDYFVVKDNGKYIVIDKDENIILQENIDDILSIKDDIVVYKYQNNFYIYNIKTSAKLDKSYKELRYTDNNLLIAKTNDKYGIINVDGEEKLEEKYTIINYYSNAEIYELEEENVEENVILNRDLEEITSGIISEINKEHSYIKVWNESGYEYYNFDGESKKSSDVLGNNNLFLSKKNNKYGYVDKDGNVVVDYIYDDAREQNDYGYAAVKLNGLWGSIDKKGKVICEPKYNLDKNILIDFIGNYHLGVDTNLMHYTNK